MTPAEWRRPVCSSYLYTLKFIVSNVGDACGPLIGIVLFLFMGNNWEVRIPYP